jgi:hypothetical protein
MGYVPSVPGFQIHHIASDKAIGSGFTKLFEEIFEKAEMDLQHPANKMRLPGHAGRHSEKYHQYVLETLSKATKGRSGVAYRRGLIRALNRLENEIRANIGILKGDGL